MFDLARSVLEAEFANGAHLTFIGGQFWRFVGTHWIATPPEEVGGIVLRHLHAASSDGKMSRRSTIREIVDLIKMSQSSGGNIFEHGETLPLLNLRNGQLVIGLDGTFDLQGHGSGSGQRHCLDVFYDPSAVCPLYDRALEQIFSNAASPAALIAYFNEIAGYILQPSRPDARIFVFWGDGSDGKSALIALLVRMLGADQIAAMPVERLAQNPFMVGHLRGKRLFLDDDVAVGTVLPDGLLKTISEAKVITGELKHRDGIEFVVRTTPMLLCNSVPILQDTLFGFQRRLAVTRFNRCFTSAEADRTLFSRIWETERSGILNRWLDGLQRIINRGWKFDLPEEVERTTDEFFRQATSSARNDLDKKMTTEATVGFDLRPRPSGYAASKNISSLADVSPRTKDQASLAPFDLRLKLPASASKICIELERVVFTRKRSLSW